MRHPPGIVWRFFGARITLAPLDHADLDRLYKLRRLPLVSTLFPGAGGAQPPPSPEPLAKCIQSFEAILATSLLKAQPWLSPRAAAVIITIYCRTWSGGEVEGGLYREVRSLGELTLETLVSQHRVRFASLVALAEKYERVARRLEDAEHDSRIDPT